MQDDDETDEHDVEREDEDMVDAGADLFTLLKEQMMTTIAMVKGQTRTLLSLQVWP